MHSRRDPNSLEDIDASTSFAHSLSTAPLSTDNTIRNISIALGSNADAFMTDVSMSYSDLQHQSETGSHLAAAELLVSLAQTVRDNDPVHHNSLAAASGVKAESQHSPDYIIAVDYVDSVKKAYMSNPQIYSEFMTTLQKYHSSRDQPDLLTGFKEFLPETQGLLNQLMSPMMYSSYKADGTNATQNGSQTTIPRAISSPRTAGDLQDNRQLGTDNIGIGHTATDFLSLIRELSMKEPDMYQHMIMLLRKFQKDHSYANLHFYASIVLRNHPHLLLRLENFLPRVPADVETTEPQAISMAPPEDLVISRDFVEAKDFVQAVKYEAKGDMSLYDRFTVALDKYHRMGWTVDQVYSEVSLIMWNHPDELAQFQEFITTISQRT
ncbi:hypothetical protein BGX28_006727 [Mortierella sp. GBA30]|nr:hypothetical protein BGX28_006727 [Mortierella sp. GBA30]